MVEKGRAFNGRSFFLNKIMEKTEYQAGATLIEDGIKFSVNGIFKGKKTLTIKPLKPGTVVRISQLAGKITEVNEKNNMSQELLANGKNLKHIAGIIAHAIINQRFFKKWKFRYYRWMLLNRVDDLKHLRDYFNLVYRQMGGDHFFFIMALTPGMNYLKRKEPESNEAEKPSGEQSDSSKKHSG